MKYIDCEAVERMLQYHVTKRTATEAKLNIC